MHTKIFSTLVRAQLVAGMVVLAVSAARAATSAPPADAFPTFESYIKVSGQMPFISGNEAAFQKRTQQSANGGLGIEDLHYLKELEGKTTLTFDGRALSGTEDYLAQLNLTKLEMGSFEVGYKRFRTFYDGIGGFFPVNNRWHALNPEELHLDRGAFWAEAKLNLPNQPALTLRYTNETRDGRKDSTGWGETDDVGQPYRTLNGGLVGSNNNATVRKNTPSYLDIAERHEILEGIAKHQIGKTRAQLTLVGDWTSKANGRFVTRFPGEQLLVTPAFVAITPAVGTAASEWRTFQNQVQQSTYDNQDTRALAAILTTVTELTPKLTLRTNLRYRDVNSDFSGDRVIVTNTPTGPGFAGGLPVTTTYNTRNLAGKSTVDLATGSVGLDFKPSPNFIASLALRGEDKDADSRGTYDVVAAPNANLDLGGGVRPPTGTTVPITTPRREGSGHNEQSLTPVLDLRHTGFKNVALYASVIRKVGKGDENYIPPYNPALDPRVAVPPAPANPLNQIISPNTYFNDITENNGDYTLGADWHQSVNLDLRAEVFYKNHAFHSNGYNTRDTIAGTAPTTPITDNNYELDSQFRGAKLTAVCKPSMMLSFTTRYIYQKGKMQVTGYLPTFPAYDSMDSRNHTISETIDWTPTSQFYVQASGTLVYNVISTAYPRAGSVAAAGVVPANLFLHNADNNYSTTSLVAGAALTKIDDLQVQFTTYRANNFNPQLALYTQPYGASATEYTAVIGLKHKFSDRFLGSAKLGYIDSKNDTTGGNTNFRGPLAYVSVEYRL